MLLAPPLQKRGSPCRAADEADVSLDSELEAVTAAVEARGRALAAKLRRKVWAGKSHAPLFGPRLQALRLANEKLKTRLTREARAEEALELEPEAVAAEARCTLPTSGVSCEPFAAARCR